MGCPIHIWLPLMGAAAPFARVARDKFRSIRPRREAVPTEPREIKRWAPVGQPSESTEANS